MVWRGGWIWGFVDFDSIFFCEGWVINCNGRMGVESLLLLECSLWLLAPGSSGVGPYLMSPQKDTNVINENCNHSKSCIWWFYSR